MKLTTLCYIIKNGKWLFLHRTKKENDLNHAKWIGVGGKLEENESPDDCLVREVYEETGLSLDGFSLRGNITFISDEWENEMMFLYTANDFTGELGECDEGELEWIDEKNIKTLNLWEGDKIFIDLLLQNHAPFSLKLCYSGEKLTLAVLNGKKLDI